MGSSFAELSEKHIEFIEKQKIYFVATAMHIGKINLSPKGGDTLRVLNSKRIVWLNLTGSGNETSTHVINNCRMTIMFCAFEGKPLILRVYGKAKVLHRKDAEWEEYLKFFPESISSRQIFILDLDLVQTSCGMSVPYYNYAGDRDDLTNYWNRKGKDAVEKYWKKKNQKSIDGFDSELAKRVDL